MTEQEAEALTARLTRIWGPQWVEDTHTLEWKHEFAECMYCARIEENVGLTANTIDGLCLSLDFYTSHDTVGSVTVQPNGQIEVDEQAVSLAVEWMPLFRRNCWLSGCPIEASAHEKAEWLQGFSREEVETWGLKM